MFDDQTNILNGSYSWYQGVQVEGIKDRVIHKFDSIIYLFPGRHFT